MDNGPRYAERSACARHCAEYFTGVVLLTLTAAGELELGISQCFRLGDGDLQVVSNCQDDCLVEAGFELK